MRVKVKCDMQLQRFDKRGERRWRRIGDGGGGGG